MRNIVTTTTMNKRLEHQQDMIWMSKWSPKPDNFCQFSNVQECTHICQHHMFFSNAWFASVEFYRPCLRQNSIPSVLPFWSMFLCNAMKKCFVHEWNENWNPHVQSVALHPVLECRNFIKHSVFQSHFPQNLQQSRARFTCHITNNVALVEEGRGRFTQNQALRGPKTQMWMNWWLSQKQMCLN